MSIETGFYGIAALIVLLLLRLPVALALILVSFGGMAAMLGWAPAFGILSSTPYSFVASWTLSAVPMFLLMGFVAFHAGLTTGLFEAAKAVLRRIPGALAISSIFACSGFAAVCGSSLACAAAMGRIAIPRDGAGRLQAEFRLRLHRRRRHHRRADPAVDPDDRLWRVRRNLDHQGVRRRHHHGADDGSGPTRQLCCSCAGCAQTSCRAGRWIQTGGGAGEALLRIWPVLVLIALVFGGMFSGLFTATEAGAVGAFGAIAIAALTGRLGWAALKASLIETLTTSASLFVIAFGAAMFTRFLGVSGLSGFISQWVGGADIGYVELMVIVVLLYLALGMFMEPFGALLVTLPVLLPVFEAQQIDLIWFGVLVVKLLEIGMITPPVGLNVFVIRSVAAEHASVMQIFRGVVARSWWSMWPWWRSSSPGRGWSCSFRGCWADRRRTQELPLLWRGVPRGQHPLGSGRESL